MGDKQANVQMSDINFEEKSLYLWVPFGYIEYTYGNDSKDYYFIESLNDKKISYSTFPSVSTSGVEVGCGTSFFIFILYSISIYFAYKLVHTTNLPYLNYLFYAIVIGFVVDFFSIFIKSSSVTAENVQKRKKYMTNIFKENHDKLKDLISRLDKPYKD